MRKRLAQSSAILAAAAMLAVAPAPAAAARAPAWQPPPAGETPDTLRSPGSYVARYPFARTMGECVLMNVTMTLFGRYIMAPDGWGFRVSAKTIKENAKAGFEWDDNSFSANNFRHPYQGGLYYGAARANGYDFYGASLFSFAGAWLFEYAGEAHHPSVNDWVNTSVGGIVLGEILFRLSNTILDNTATGSERAWRETGGFALCPLRGLNRLITGEMFDVHANPPDRFPRYTGGVIRVGERALGEERFWHSSSAKPFFSIDGYYGDVFDRPVEKPFEYFTFGAQLNLRNTPHGIGRLKGVGALRTVDVSKRESAHHVLGAFMHFDYVDNEAYTFGGQSAGVGFRSRFRGAAGVELRTALDANAILLGATKSDHFNISGREYDYGPGAAVGLSASVSKNGFSYLTLGYAAFYLHSINGNIADHYVDLTQVKFDFPVVRPLQLGLEYVNYNADRRYRDYPDVSKRNPELRAYAFLRFD